MFTAPISAFILLVLVASTGLPDTSAFQTSSDVNSEHPDDPMTWPPPPVVPAAPVAPDDPDDPAWPPPPAVPVDTVVAIEPPPHPPTTPIAAASNKHRMARSYTRYSSSRRRRTSDV